MSTALIPVEDGHLIDRSQPAILQGRMNSDDWNTFCDQYDVVAVPSSPRRPSRMSFLTTLMWSFVVDAIIIIVGVVRYFTGTADSDSKFHQGVPAILLGVAWSIVTSVIITITFFFFCDSTPRKLYKSAMETFCKEASKNYPGFTFRFKKDNNSGSDSDSDSDSDDGQPTKVKQDYIEIIIADTLLTATHPGDEEA